MRDIPPVAKAWPSAVWLERPWPRDTLDAEEGTRIKAAYSGGFERLLALKNKLAFAPNGCEPRLPMPRQPRRAVVMAHLHEARRDDVIAPSIEIEEAAIALVGKVLLVISSGV